MLTISIVPAKLTTMAAPRLFTTHAGAQRLGTPAEGLAPWQSTKINKPDGATLRITATPARHGPAGIEPLSGDVIGFMASFSDGTPPLYVTGDTVWYDGVAEVARRFRPGVVLLSAGAARTRGPFDLTMNTNDAIETAHAFPDATIVPIHCDGWAHFHTKRRGPRTFVQGAWHRFAAAAARSRRADNNCTFMISASAKKRTSGQTQLMSAFEGKADIARTCFNVRYDPKRT